MEAERPYSQTSFQRDTGGRIRQKGEELETCNIEDNWGFLRDNLLQATDQICGWGKVPARLNVTWWWNSTVDRAIKSKREAWKDWKKGGSKEKYQVARR